ncbi:MAG: carboxypeptidase-like regulatory domain-containing protein [Candidatus Nanohaloarchaea archaeon]
MFSEAGTIDANYGASDEARCNHTVTNLDSYSGFEYGEKIDYKVQFTGGDLDQKTNTTEEYHRNPNTYLKLENSAGTAQSGVSVTAYQTETSTVASTGEDSTDECSGVTTDSNGWFSCGLSPNGDYDLKVNGIPRINDIDVDSEGTTRVLHYNQYDSSELGKYHYLNVTAVNQTADRLSDANYSVEKAGTSKEFFMTEQQTDDGEIQVPLDPREIYDVAVDTSKYEDDLLFRNVRVPDVIQSGFNQNFLPESTLANSIKFSAGHVISAQTQVPRPFSNFDVVNITVEKNLSNKFRMVSEVLVKKFNKSGGVETCSTQPESSTYFFIDEADCPLLGKMNVSQDEWFRLDYRFRIPGPESFSGAGDTNQYNVSDTIVRFDVL